MANRITKGKALVGNLVIADGRARVKQSITATIARTDTTAKNLFKIPADAVIHLFHVSSPAVSNAGTTATISVGKTGLNTFFLNVFDVRGATGANQQLPAAANLGNVGTTEIQVVGIYAETGVASTTGGPWTITMDYSIPI